VTVMAGAWPGAPVLIILTLYSVGAHGIMTLNDFKAVEGDRITGIRSLPAVLGESKAARIACAAMALPQGVVIALLIDWHLPVHAGAIGLLLAAQLLFMRRLLRDPRGRAPWYNATGVSAYVSGMLIAAFGIGSLL